MIPPFPGPPLPADGTLNLNSAATATGFSLLSWARRWWRRIHPPALRSGRQLRPQVDELEPRTLLSVFHVNTFSDTLAVNLKNGHDAKGHVSLRSALMAANHLGGTNSIIMPAGMYSLTLSATKGELNIKDNVTIQGAGAGLTIIDGRHGNRVFQVESGFVVTIADVTIQRGRSHRGAGIYTSGTLTLENDGISNNNARGLPGENGRSGRGPSHPAQAGAQGGVAEGAGIYVAAGSLTISNSTIAMNIAQGGAGGRGGQGATGQNGANGTTGHPAGGNGGTGSSGAAGGQGGAAQGGGIYVATGTVVIQNSSVTGNQVAGGNGGAGGAGGRGGHGGSGVFRSFGSSFSSGFGFGSSSGFSSGGSGGSGGVSAPARAAANLARGGNGGNGGNGGPGGDGGLAQGGGIFNATGVITLMATTVSGNQAMGGNGGTGGLGGKRGLGGAVGGENGMPGSAGSAGQAGTASDPDLSGTIMTQAVRRNDTLPAAVPTDVSPAGSDNSTSERRRNQTSTLRDYLRHAREDAQAQQQTLTQLLSERDLR